ncbi:MAG: hypothetical protein FWC03_10245 [Treponema sp.]|nr:hypothetical protein [Treponema sp.]
MRLYSNPKIVFISRKSQERFYLIIAGDMYDLIFSQGDVILSGSYFKPGGYGFGDNWEDILDLIFTKGWNPFYFSRIFNEDTRTLTFTGVSKNPMSYAVWVMR